MKIGILGGTFDPIHSGHLAIAAAAKEQFHLNKVIFVPAFVPPHKADKRNMTPAPYRYRMVELAIRDNPAFEISDIELNRSEVSYTVDTLRDMGLKYPKAQLYLIMGADSLSEIENWRDPDEIKKRAIFLVAPRNGHQPSDFSQDPRIQWLSMKPLPAASTQIRALMEKNRKSEKEGAVLPKAVFDYIVKMNLYSNGAPCS